VGEQLLLALHAAGVAPHAAVGADDPVARADDGQRVGADGGAQRLDPVARDAELGGQLAVGDRRAVLDRVQGLPDPLLEFGAARGEIEAEGGQLPGEVRGELADHLGEGRRVTAPAVADLGRIALPGHRHRGERHAAWRGAADQEQFTYRAFHRGVDVHGSTL
jgi:hypothetical protein